MSQCDIIVPVWNQLEFTKDCIKSINKNTEIAFRLIIIDNGSDDETKGYLCNLKKNFNNMDIIRNEKNLGFIKAVNMGLKISNAPYICLINNDTIVTKGWLRRMIDLAETNKSFGLINPVGKGHLEHNMLCDEYGEFIFEKNKGKYLETAQAMGYCMLIKREALERIGVLDEAFGIGGFDDTDFSRRAFEIGYKCVSALDSYVYHRESVSFKTLGSGEERIKKNESIFFNKWEKFYRILYVAMNPSKEQLIRHFHLSIGFARNWHWVHFWVLGKNDIIKSYNDFIKDNNISGHQNLRKFFYEFSKRNFFVKQRFFINLVFGLIGRKLKKKGHKQFDLIITDNFQAASFLFKIKTIIKIPIYFEVSNFNELKVLKKSFLDNLDGIFTANKEIFSNLKEKDIVSKLILLPYGLEDPESLKKSEEIFNFEKSWKARAKGLADFIKNNAS